MKTNAGKLPSNAMLIIGARLPIQREQSHSEARRNKPTYNPKTRMLSSLPANPRKPHPRKSSGQSGGNDSHDKLFQNSFSEDICARLAVLTSSRQSGPASIAVSTSRSATNAVPASATTVSIPSLGGRGGDMILIFA